MTEIILAFVPYLLVAIAMGLFVFLIVAQSVLFWVEGIIDRIEKEPRK